MAKIETHRIPGMQPLAALAESDAAEAPAETTAVAALAETAAVAALAETTAAAALAETAAVAALAALAHAPRLRVFRALVGAAPGGMTPGDLALLLGMPGSTLSFHLRELTRAGLLDARRDGRHIVYRPQVAVMNGLLAYLTAHCCQGQDCGLGAPAGSCAPAAADPAAPPRPAPAAGPACPPASRC